MPTHRDFDLIVYGATGFTGRLVAEHLLAAYGVSRGVRWAMAGRSRNKLQAVRDAIGAPAELPLVTADASDRAGLAAMAARTRVVLTTVGPYQLHGEPVLAACAHTGTDYVDLCGEPAWMAAMIERHEAKARSSGARIVFSCGFDSIPFDLGVAYLQAEAQAALRAPLRRVRGRVRRMKGGFSGGTIASLMATLESAEREPSILRTLSDPFALTPGFTGPRQPLGDRVEHDDDAGQWATPFVMATINTKNVHRTNFLLGHPWGRDFVYDEMLLTGDGVAGRRRAIAAKRRGDLQNVLLGFAPSRALLRRFALPQPGQGPSKQERETGCFELMFSGETADGRPLRASVEGDKDPGYGSTSKMIAEAALCLAHDVPREVTAGGVWTPAAALGMTLVRRLQSTAGVRFARQDRPPG